MKLRGDEGGRAVERFQVPLLFREGVGRGLLLANVRVGAEPADDAPLLVPQGLDARQEGTENAVGAPQREDHVEGLAGGDRCLPALQHGGQHGGIVHRLPAPTFHLGRCRAGVFMPAAVVPENPAVRVRDPGKLGQVVGKGDEIGGIESRRMPDGGWRGDLIQPSSPARGCRLGLWGTAGPDSWSRSKRVSRRCRGRCSTPSGAAGQARGASP